MTQIEIRCKLVQKLFNLMMFESSRTGKEQLVRAFRDKYPKMNKDLDYCFEVLAGQHKLGYTFVMTSVDMPTQDFHTIRELVEYLKKFGSTNDEIVLASYNTPRNCRPFIASLVNREYKLGYSNKRNMIKSYSPMLAKRYPETFHSQHYYIQEKLDGNRCIAQYNEDEQKWQFWSRSGKPLKVNFDMSWAETCDVFDGEIMTLNHAGSRDFNTTSGAINGKYTDKSQLHYFIYDIVDETRTYEQRYQRLKSYDRAPTGNDCTILKVLDKIYLYPNTEYNWQLDEWLDKITAKGGEGIMLRDPDAYYQCGKRTDALIKYKKTKTMDLRIIDWNEGKGKYTGMIGSFVCQDDLEQILVNVAGMPDEIREADPNLFIGKIIEVAYFDESVSKTSNKISLRFPRLKKFRDDKDTTSIY